MIRQTRDDMPNRSHAVGGIVRVLVAGLLTTVGCIPSYPLADNEIDGYWTLTEVPDEAITPVRAATPAEPGAFRMPDRWVIRQHKSLIWSTVSIVRAMDKLKAGTNEVEFSVSPAHARALVDVLARARSAMADLKDMLDTAGRADENRWAEALASALVKIESVSRLVTVEEPAPDADAPAEPLGMAGEPMLGLIAEYLDKRSGGGLLADLTPKQRKRLRDVLAQMALRLGFEVAGKQPPEALHGEVARLLRSGRRLEELAKPLGALLARHLSRAAPAPAGRSKRKTVRTVLTWAPKALGLFESFLRQWDRMDSITVEFGRHGAAVIIAARPGRQVRIANVTALVPTIVFRGSTRVAILPEAAGTGESVVAFDPVGDGAVELRFEGVLWGLVKALALPLASGPVREVRVFSDSRPGGEQLVHVAVLTEAAGDRSDPRRMIVVQDSRTKTLRREAFAVRSVTTRSETVVSYLTPTRRYTYQRIKRAGEK